MFSDTVKFMVLSADGPDLRELSCSSSCGAAVTTRKRLWVLPWWLCSSVVLPSCVSLFYCVYNSKYPWTTVSITLNINVLLHLCSTSVSVCVRACVCTYVRVRTRACVSSLKAVLHQSVNTVENGASWTSDLWPTQQNKGTPQHRSICPQTDGAPQYKLSKRRPDAPVAPLNPKPGGSHVCWYDIQTTTALWIFPWHGIRPSVTEGYFPAHTVGGRPSWTRVS